MQGGDLDEPPALCSDTKLSPEYYQQVIDDLIQQNDNFSQELELSREAQAEAEKATQSANFKLEKTMAVVDEMKTLKHDVFLFKKKTAEDEMQLQVQIERLQEQKKELELNFNTMQESHNKEKETLHVQIIKMQKRAMILQGDLAAAE